MKTSFLCLAALPVLLVAGCYSPAPDEEDPSTLTSDLQASTIVSRGMEWVNAKLHYCQAPHGAVDGDSSCWAWEGSSHRCDRESNAAWNAYRSDCSGFVTFAWGLPAVGDGGYVTGRLRAVRGTLASRTPSTASICSRATRSTRYRPDEHIILFKQWVTQGPHGRLHGGARLLVVRALRARVHLERVDQRRQGLRQLRGRDVLRDPLQRLHLGRQ